MRKLNKWEFCYAKTVEQAKELLTTNELSAAYAGNVSAVWFMSSVPWWTSHDYGDYYEMEWLTEVSYEELCREVSTDVDTPTVALADVYVLNEDVDAYLKKGCVIVMNAVTTTIIDNEPLWCEIPDDTMVRLEVLIKHAPNLFTKLT